MTYKILIQDKDYINYKIYKYETYEEVTDFTIDPVENKLFNDDVFEIKNNKVILIHSILQSTQYIPGVLMLTNNILGKKGEKFLYQCIPDDQRLPVFVIPYENKIDFNKVKRNRYITFKYSSWENKHPQGVLSQNLGSVEDLNPYYEYQLYCKSLNNSIQKFTKYSREKTQNTNIYAIINKLNINLEDRSEIYTFTIDSQNTQDYDDAYSIQKINDTTTILSIYITNVALILDTLDLWESFSERICTIYLPDKKRPMIPTILSSSLCTLKKNETRIAYAMDIKFENDDVSIEIKNVIINTNDNFIYDQKELDTNIYYKESMSYVKRLHNKQAFSYNLNTSSDFVSYLMMFMNYECSKMFVKNKNGIFRTSTLNSTNENIPQELQSFIQILHSSAGIYTTKLFEPHELMKFDSYIHITSPLRRLVDLLNSIILMKNNNIYHVSDNGNKFYEKYINKLDYINTTSRIIRKLQYNCQLLQMFYNDNNENKTFDGYIFDKIIRNDNLYVYSVYIPSIRMVSKIICHESYENYSKHEFSIHIFKNNEKFKKKVRLHIMK